MDQHTILERLERWATESTEVRALVLTSSRVNGSDAPVDQFSDYDVAVYVSSLEKFKTDKWLDHFGNKLICWPPTPQTTFNKEWLTRLVIFEDRTRIDFQITINISIPPSDYDLGYQTLVDKDGFTQRFSTPTRTLHLVKKPTEQEFLQLVNDFFWDATYVVKYLWRGEIFYAKYMFDSSLRFEYFEKMIEWYIGQTHNWQVSVNVHGRYFSNLLPKDIWNEILQTFAGACIDDNWRSFYKMVDLFTRFAKQVSIGLGYQYPDSLEEKMRSYYLDSQNLTR